MTGIAYLVTQRPMTSDKGRGFEDRPPKPFSDRSILGSAASQWHVAQREVRQKE